MSKKVEEAIQKLNAILEDKKYEPMKKSVNIRLTGLKKLKKRLENFENPERVRFPRSKYGKRFIRFLYDIFGKQEFTVADAYRAEGKIPLEVRYNVFGDWESYHIWRLARKYHILNITLLPGPKKGKYSFKEEAIPEVEKFR